MNKKMNLAELALTAALACSTAEEGQKEREASVLSGAGGEERYFNFSNIAGYGGQTTNTGAAGEGGADGAGGEDCSLKGKFTTYTQGGWHNAASDLIPLGPEGVRIGDETADYALFTSKEAVAVFLPTEGTPGALQGQYVNPQSTPAGVLAGQTLALTLNVNFNWDGCGYLLEELVVADGPCKEMTVSEVLYQANAALAGGQGSLSYSQLNGCATKINQNFHEGLEDNGYLTPP